MRVGTPRLVHAGLMSLLLTLALAGCGGYATTRTAAKLAATATIPSLNWRKVTMPTDITHGGVSMSISPVNGRDAWICGDGSAAGQFLIWRTQDAGATWQQISTLSPVAPPPTAVSTACSVIPDQNLATSLAIWLPTDDPSAIPGSTSSALAYYSSDSGVTWTQMPQNWWIDQIATSADTTYALVNDLGNKGNVNLFISSDHFNTWRSVNPQVQEMTQNPPVMWVAPDTGDTLLSLSYINQIYHSSDGGGQWNQLAAQSGQPPATPLAVWRGQSDGWLICGGSPNGLGTQTTCSVDMGKTWSARPTAVDTSCRQVGLTNDGALYDVCAAAGASSSPYRYALMRLPLGSSAWTAVGLAPDRYITVTQSGQVWCNTGDGSATYVLDQLP